MAHQPVGTGSSVQVSVNPGHSRTSGVISQMSDTLRVVLVGADNVQGAHVAISRTSTDPSASSADYLVLKNEPTTISINRPASQRVV